MLLSNIYIAVSAGGGDIQCLRGYLCELLIFDSRYKLVILSKVLPTLLSCIGRSFLWYGSWNVLCCRLEALQIDDLEGTDYAKGFFQSGCMQHLRKLIVTFDHQQSCYTDTCLCEPSASSLIVYRSLLANIDSIYVKVVLFWSGSDCEDVEIELPVDGKIAWPKQRSFVT